MFCHRHRGSDDACAVTQFRRYDLRLDIEERNPLLVFPGDPAPHDEQLGIEEPLILIEHLADLSGPLLPGEVLVLLHRPGGTVLGLHAIDDEVPQLSVGKQLTIHEER